MLPDDIYHHPAIDGIPYYFKATEKFIYVTKEDLIPDLTRIKFRNCIIKMEETLKDAAHKDVPENSIVYLQRQDSHPENRETVWDYYFVSGDHNSPYVFWLEGIKHPDGYHSPSQLST